MKIESDTVALLPPLFQPLRLWTPRLKRTAKNRPGSVKPELGTRQKCASMRSFSMRGGFVSDADGERRMVIVGRLFRNREL